MTNYVFQDYRQVKPSVAGSYVWRLAHKFIDGVVLVFVAIYRERGAGLETVLSPVFDHWDGYRVLLPKGSIEWAEYGREHPQGGQEILEIVGVNNEPCPFCGNVPNWRYIPRYIGSGPTDTSWYYLDCCRWFSGFHNRMTNPVNLSEMRNSALRKYRDKEQP